MAKETEDLLDRIYKASKMGMEAAEALIPKVHVEPLREQIEFQEDNYKETAAKAKAMMRQDGRLPNERAPYQKAMLRSTIKMHTLMDSSPRHIAEMMINGTTMGIIEMTKRLNEENDADIDARWLAENYLENEQNNIEELKSYL
jgi:hypothetical protein